MVDNQREDYGKQLIKLGLEEIAQANGGHSDDLTNYHLMMIDDLVEQIKSDATEKATQSGLLKQNR